MYKPGQSGNPEGRPKGSFDKRTSLRRMLEADAPAIIAKCVEMAKGGDPVALRLVLDRVCTPLRSSIASVQFSLPDDVGLVAKGEAVLSAIASGDLAPDTGNQLMSSIVALARLKEFIEIDERLRALEEKHHAS